MLLRYRNTQLNDVKTRFKILSLKIEIRKKEFSKKERDWDWFLYANATIFKGIITCQLTKNCHVLLFDIHVDY